jgi:acyl phosphate:glycerol-3-phosphate acyltransferase
MIILNTILVLVLAYLLGSIPSAVWIGKKFHKTDIREHGSGNAGTANVIRVLGWKTGIPVLLIDVAKGWTAAALPIFFNLAEPDSAAIINLQILAGVIAIVGHIFPLFAGFKGGKGVATVFGTLLALKFFLTLSCFGVFLAMFLVTGIISVSSMAAGLAFPIFLFTIFETPSLVFKIFSVLVAIALLITHRKNIVRLLKGEEARLFTFGKKEKLSD